MFLLCASLASAADVDEFRVKRAEVFEFAEAPRLTRDGDRVEITFATTAACDVTVAVEDAAGRIVRHLASGVLGPNAPAPLAKNSLRQSLIWDGKNDQDQYVNDPASHKVRVSLGLKPMFERNLYWSPYKRVGESAPLVQVAPEGVYVYDGRGHDHLMLYDHQGNYLRTIHPFAADKLERVLGLNLHPFPQDGQTLPIKNSLYQQTLLSSGDNASLDDRGGMDGTAATALDVRDGRIALAKLRLNRLASDGTTGGLPLTGAETAVTLINFKVRYTKDNVKIAPTSCAISPDGRWVYLAGYAYRFAMNFHCLSGVYRVPYDQDGPLELFAGGEGIDNFGTEDKELTVATSVACDAQGRVYIGDYGNDRVKVFSPEGELLKTIPTYKPAQLRIDRRTGDLYVFSWLVCNNFLYERGKQTGLQTIIPARLTQFGPFDRLEQKAQWDLPLPEFKGRYSTYTGIDHALLYCGEVDTHTDPPTIWLTRDSVQNIERGVHPGDGGRKSPWEQAGIQLLRPAPDGKLELVRDFGREVTGDPTVVRARPPANAIQRLHANPATGKLYVAEADSGATIKASLQLVEIDPATAQAKLIDLPFNALEFDFDHEGLIYLRTTNVIARYDPATWREVPFDYGEELPKVGCGLYGRFSKVTGGLVMPATSPVCFHQGGFSVSPQGNIVASCAYRYSGDERSHEPTIRADLGGGGDEVYGQPYTPKVYPGRVFSSTGAALHVWDKHGKVLFEDAVPGVPQMDGVYLGRDNSIYAMLTPRRVLDGQRYFDEMSETVVKYRPNTGKIIGSNDRAPVPLPAGSQGDTPPDLHNGTLKNGWAEEAQWFYGGVGFAGFNTSRAGGGCACWFARFTMDYFARSFAPEPLHYSVAVLDSAGNLITRVGRYGNVDSAGPNSAVPLGGDEVGLFYACYVGTHTDRRLFISDVGNGRIVSVRLDYHASEILPLTDAVTAAK